MRETPVIVGNTVTFAATKELMETGIAAVLVGVGPGAACTSREVLGIGVPQVTATIDAAAARDTYYRESGRYVPIITDGGVSNGGAMCKAFAAGADGVMLGSILAATEEAPGRGHHWGMATPHGELPRGTRVKVAIDTTVRADAVRADVAHGRPREPRRRAADGDGDVRRARRSATSRRPRW